MFGSGFETRDFIYVGDLVRAIELVISSNAIGKYPYINIANGEEVLIKNAIETFAEIINLDPKKVKFSGVARTSDPSNWKSDIAILKSLGYNPNFSLEEGLKNYYKWLQSIENE
jgi:UDP-glucose 4-epimerase